MKITVLQENLAKGLAIVGRAVNTKNNLPVLRNVLLASDNGRLRLAATNLEMGVTCWVGATIETEGAVTLPAETLRDLIATMEGRVTITLNPKTVTARIQAGTSDAKLKGLDAQEFPVMQSPASLDGVVHFPLPAASFKEVVQQVAFAASTDEARPVLTGVHIIGKGKKLLFETADGFRLAQRHLELKDALEKPVNTLIPARTMIEVAGMLSEEFIMLHISDSQVFFQGENLMVTSQTVAGEYPNIGQVIPTEITTRVVSGIGQLQTATKQADIFAREGAHIIRINITPPNGHSGQVKIAGQSVETGASEHVLDTTVEGPEQKLGLNSKFLKDGLGAIKTPNVEVAILNDTAPVVLRPVGETGYLHVIMPMHLDETPAAEEAKPEVTK